MKKYLLSSIVIGLGLVLGTFAVEAQVSPGVGFFKLTGTTLHPVNSSWNVGVGGTTTAAYTLSVQGSFGSSATGTFNGIRATSTLQVDSGRLLFRGVDYITPSADGTSGQILSTDGNGVLSWVADSAGGAANLIYSLVGGTKYYTASSTATDNLAFRFNNGFVSAASSTISAGDFYLQVLHASSTATSTFTGAIDMPRIYLNGNAFNTLTGAGLSVTGGILNILAGSCITVSADSIAVTDACVNATTLDSIDSTSFLFSDASDSYTAGTLTFDAGTTLDLNTTTLLIADTDIAFDGATTAFTFTGDWGANTNQLTLLKTSGFFGIASATPRALLSVQGTTQLAGTTTMLNGVISTSTAYFGNLVTNSTSTFLGLTISSQGLKVSNLTSCSSELETDSAGNVICGASSAGTPAGTDGQVQYNDGGSAFGGAVGFIWDDINLFLGVGSTTPRAVLSVQGNSLTSGTTTTGVLHATSSIIRDLVIGPAGSLRLPVSDSPTVNTQGTIGLDTTDYQLLVATGTTVVVYGRQVKRLYSFNVGTTSALTVTATTSVGLPPERDGYTVLYGLCSVWGGTSMLASLVDGDNNRSNTVTCTTASSTERVFTVNNAFTASEGVQLDIGTRTGSVYQISVALYGTITRE